MSGEFSHIDQKGNPRMVDVSGKSATSRMAQARAVVHLGKEIMSMLEDGEISTKKGPVFQTAIIAGTMGLKKTSEIIPFCHPIPIDGCSIEIASLDEERILIHCLAKTEGKTGVEMEALTGASVAALTVYDMCKAISHDIRVEELRLVKKLGGKSDFQYNE